MIVEPLVNGKVSLDDGSEFEALLVPIPRVDADGETAEGPGAPAA